MKSHSRPEGQQNPPTNGSSENVEPRAGFVTPFGVREMRLVASLIFRTPGCETTYFGWQFIRGDRAVGGGLAFELVLGS